MENEIITGKLTYREVEFSFVFDGKELRLISPKEKRHEIEMEWIMHPIGNGAYTFGGDLKMEAPYLVGECNENGHRYIFFTQQGEHIGSKNSILFIDVIAYMEYTVKTEEIDKITFSSPEINCIHPVNSAFTYSFDQNNISNNGVFTLTTLDFDATSTEKQYFSLDEMEISVNFGISRRLSTKIGESPVILNSSMNFEFAPTRDFEFVIRLWRVAREFVRFLCYRKNVCLSTAEISAPYKDGKHLRIGTLYFIDDGRQTEIDTLKKGRYIKQQYIAGSEGKILSDIADNLLYTRHIPATYEDGRHIDAARFIMITAAFEWEFHREYPEGIPRKESTIEIEKQADETIQELINKSTGKLKKKYQFLKKLIKSDSLQNEIVKMGEDYDVVLGVFGRHLYHLNDEELNYKEMGERLANQRNHFAHGDLDKDFIGLSLLDLIYMEYVVYAMQLKRYGINDDNIRKCINELFHLNFTL